jgi:two-component system LytT family response regulator
MLRTIIIEDVEQERFSLRQMLAQLRPDVEIIGEAGNIQTARNLIEKSSPDLIFLDIQLPDGTGFDLLESFPLINFKVIFITAFQEYAVRAFKFSAVDYLLKPVSAEELLNAIDKAEHILTAEYSLKLNTLLNNHRTNNNDDKRIILKTMDKIHVVRIKDIVRCQSDGGYCHFNLLDGERITVSKPLKEFDGLLNDMGFFRVHKSHLVNVKLINRFDKSEGGYVIMEVGDKVPVSHYRKEALLAHLETL